MDRPNRAAHDVGTRLEQARKAAGLSLRETARRIGVSPATLSAVENGRTGVSVPRLRALAAELGTTVPWLIGEPPRERPPRSRPTSEGGLRQLPAADWREFPPLSLDPVLAAAIESFVETGYHGATMRSIADRAGMSVPGVYHHYHDKQELLVRALDLTMDELHRRVRAAGAQGTTAMLRLIHTVEALALYHTHRRELAFIGASEMRSLTSANRQRIAASRNELQYLLDDVIAAALGEAGLPHDGAHVAGRAIATMCTALPQWFRLDGPLSPEQIATQYADFAVGLLGLSPARAD
ncbi:TetR family transcriptional regulator [Nocardia spumae]|uniref:TetR family transcriptional regulator n=1 Tax=Nocardia spumae TaxID=2887190 RepID=UPI001D14C5BA|nr:TetR family transcriptional regulator [Nocardia spumae]